MDAVKAFVIGQKQIDGGYGCARQLNGVRRPNFLTPNLRESARRGYIKERDDCIGADGFLVTFAAILISVLHWTGKDFAYGERGGN